MTQIDFGKRALLYENYLLEKVMPFWMEHSIDKEYGGYFTCLDRKGQVYDQDKFMWLQCRQVWTLSMLYNNLEKNEAWLDAALKGAEFLIKHGRDENKDWYFALDRAGKPLVQPYNIFSDCFATMAFAQLYKATGNPEHATIAKETFERILQRRDNPKGKYLKQIPENRQLKGFSLPMILCNLVLEIEHLLEPQLVQETLNYGVNEVLNVFYKKNLGLILENVAPDGSFVDCFEGRLINPGHGLESMWFVMDVAKKLNDDTLIQKCVDISLQLLNYGWDQQYGGIFYFLDVKGYPPQQLEWDQKLGWVHLESLITALKGYQLTGNQDCLKWYEKLHDYTWSHFVDEEYGEMYGYLNRRGEVLLELKGGKWKGCFHVPRALYQLAKLAHTINNDPSKGK